MNIRNHYSIGSSNNINQIVKKFFKDTNVDINHLNYIQKNNDGTVFYLCTNPNWLTHYYNEAYPSVGAFEHNESLSNFKYVLWSSLDSGDKILHDSKNLIGIEHGITIIDKMENGYGYYNFGSNNNDKLILSKYISNLDLLNKFKTYFKFEAKNILNDSKKYSFILPAVPGGRITLSSGIVQESQKSNYEKLYIDKENNLFLTSRETECMEWYLKGKTSSEVALIMKISKRTVEAHVENVKLKLKCKNLFQVGYTIAVLKYNIHGYLPPKY